MGEYAATFSRLMCHPLIPDDPISFSLRLANSRNAAIVPIPYSWPGASDPAGP